MSSLELNRACKGFACIGREPVMLKGYSDFFTKRLVDQFNAALAMRFIHDSTQGQVLQIVRKMSRRQQLQRQSNCLNTLMSVCKLR